MCKVSYDRQPFLSKPTSEEAAGISRRIGNNVLQIGQTNTEDFVKSIAEKGHSFCPATFRHGTRKKDYYEQQQLFALDFDNKGAGEKVSFEDVLKRAEKYDLPVLFAYDTFSSKEHDRFRVVFLNDISIPKREVAEAMQLALGEIFPESDSSCYKDVSKIYYGGKKCLYYDSSIPTIDLESLFRNLSYYYKEKYKANHYKEKIQQFSEMTSIQLDRKGLLDVSVSSENPTTEDGTGVKNESGKNSPASIILEKDIKRHGEIFPEYYVINFSNTKEPSVVSEADDNITRVNHNYYRSDTLKEMEKCRLYHECAISTKRPSNEVLFGLATNMIQIETGRKRFLEIISNYDDINEEKDRLERWKYNLTYLTEKKYIPYRCDRFCPYHKECHHGKNILSTVHTKRGRIERIQGYQDRYQPLEQVQDETYQAIRDALDSGGKGIWVIKSQTAIGKTTSYLKLMEHNPGEKLLIAAPTNILKDEIYERAQERGIEVKETPSLEPLQDQIPKPIWEKIQKLYRQGRPKKVISYINKVLKEEDIPCLEDYVKERKMLQKYMGNVITTHRYLMCMDENRLKKFDAVIIDEDIIFKSIVTNQITIPLSYLESVAEETDNEDLSEKIQKLLQLAKTQTCIQLKSVTKKAAREKTDEDNTGVRKIKPDFDVKAFLRAEKFYICRASEQKGIREDMACFIHPFKFRDAKYIMVSATVNEKICEACFNSLAVNFYECGYARYMGRLKQYPQKSMSRASLDGCPGMVSRLMEDFGLPESHVITFMKESVGFLHFGNTEGSNQLEGKDILVIGTPYYAEFLYKLIAFTLDMDFDEEEAMKMQQVEHNGWKFQFTTFQDPNLRAVQFWTLESELEQAVGRARLLRHDCCVYLFSNFPLRQAEMIQDYTYPS